MQCQFLKSGGNGSRFLEPSNATFDPRYPALLQQLLQFVRFEGNLEIAFSGNFNHFQLEGLAAAVRRKDSPCLAMANSSPSVSDN